MAHFRSHPVTSSISFQSLNPKKALFLDSLMANHENALPVSLSEFDLFASGKGIPTGKLVYEVDRGFQLVLNDYAERDFLRLVASSGYASSIRGQTREIPYVKPWADNPAPYYPDFILYTYDRHVAIVEVKSILGMCQDENIVKYEYLLGYCQRHGYECAFIDAEMCSFYDYLEPLDPANPIAQFYQSTLRSVGGFTNNDLERLKKAYPSIEEKDLKRTIASLVLQSPSVSNRYCHDSPFLLNAVDVHENLAYKKWR